MAQCKPVHSLALSVGGQKAIKEIKKVTENTKKIQIGLTAGSLIVSLFNGKALSSVFSVSTTDWKLLANGIQGLPRRLSENRKPTAEKLDLARFSHYFRLICPIFASNNEKIWLKPAFPRYGLYSRTAS